MPEILLPEPADAVERIIPKPTYSLWSWCEFLAIRLLVLPLIWDILKVIVTYFAGEAVGKRFFEAQNISLNRLIVRDFQMKGILENAHDIHAQKIPVVTHDGASLDTIEIRSTSLAEDNDRPYLINFLGASQHYQLNTREFPMVEMMLEDARAQHCTVIGFNFRGVGSETHKPRSGNDLVTDGIAQVQRLLDKGVKPEKIVLNGVSLGAAIATLVAEHFYENGIKIRLFNDRSFSSMTNVIVGWIRIGDLTRFLTEGPLERRDDRITGYTEKPWNILLGWLAWPFIKCVLTLTQWDVNAGPAFAGLSKKHKACMFISSSDERKSTAPPPVDDCIISSFARIQAHAHPEKLHAAAMQTQDTQRAHDGHFKMRHEIVNRHNPGQTGQRFFYQVLSEKFNPDKNAMDAGVHPQIQG